jgi:hypothetical protein
MFTEEHFQRIDNFLGRRVNKVNTNVIIEMQDKLNPEQWVDYVNELEYLMREEIDEYMPLLKSATLEQGRGILFLKAEVKHKLQAMLIALDMWF